MRRTTTQELSGAALRWANPACAVAALGFLIWQLDWRALTHVWAHARFSTLILAVLMLGPSFPLLALRLTVLLGALGHKVSFEKSLSILFASSLLGSVVPAGTVGCDGARVWLISREIHRTPVALMIVAADRIIGLLGLSLFPLACGALRWPLCYRGQAVAFTGGLCLVGAACLLAARRWRARRAPSTTTPWPSSPDRGYLAQLSRAASVLRHAPRALGAGLTLAALSHGCILASLLIAARGLGVVPSLSATDTIDFIALTALGLLSSAMPIGVMECCFAGVLSLHAGITSPEGAVSVAAFGRVAQLVYTLPATLVLWRTLSLVPRAPKGPERVDPRSPAEPRPWATCHGEARYLNAPPAEAR